MKYLSAALAVLCLLFLLTACGEIDEDTSSLPSQEHTTSATTEGSRPFTTTGEGTQSTLTGTPSTGSGTTSTTTRATSPSSATSVTRPTSSSAITADTTSSSTAMSSNVATTTTSVTPSTLPQGYHTLKAWLKANGKKNADGHYVISGKEVVITHTLGYDPAKDRVYLYSKEEWADTDMYHRTIWLDTCRYKVTIDDMCELEGYLDAARFSMDIRLVPESYTGLPNVKDTICDLVVCDFDDMLLWLGNRLRDNKVGISPADLGFSNYQ